MFAPTEEPPPIKEKSFLYCKEQRVTSALTISELESYLTGICAEPLKSWFTKTGVSSTDETYNYQRLIYKNCIDPFYSVRPIPANIIRSLETVAHISHYAWSRTHHKVDIVGLNTSQYFLKFWNLRTEYDKMIRKFRNRVDEIVPAIKFPRLNISVSCCGDYFHIVFNDGTSLILPWMALIAIQDSIIGIVDVLCYAIISDTELKTDYYGLLVSFIQAGIKSVIDLGKNVYRVLKNLHPLSVGYILEYEMSGYTNTLKDEVLRDMPNSPLKDFWLREATNLEKSIELLKLSGLSKLFTYPIVDIEGAVNNVIEKGTKWKPECRLHSHKAANMLKKIFCREYLRQHHIWPPVTVTGPIPGSMTESIREGSWGEISGEWHPDDFEFIQIEHSINIDLFPDSTELLKDKAICVGIKSWPREYDTRYHLYKYGRRCKPGPDAPKRGIIKHLQSEEVNTLAELQKFLNIIRDGSNAIVMCIKEKELNQDKARYFTKLTWEHKFAQALSEEACKSVMRYFPHQSMTMSGLTLEKFKLRTSNKVALTISIDFAKWCLNQRGEINDETARTIDRMCGLPGLVELSHVIPQRTFCFFQDRVNIPEQLPSGLPKIGPRCYYGLLTTGEGMNQRLWTIAGASYILHYSYDLGYNIEVMAAGDNMLVVAYLKPGDVPAYAQADILSALNKMSDDIGLPIKLEETYTSNRYFEYGKSPYYDGKKISMALKKASRVGTEMQETVPSLNARLSSIFSTAVSVASEDTHPMPAFIVSLLESIAVLHDYLNVGSLSPEVLSLMLMVTRSLGGLKVTNYSSFCVRGIQDGACQNLDILRSIHELSNIYPKLNKTLLQYPIIVKPCSFPAIVRDPYNIPIHIMPDAESGIRAIIEEKLPEIVLNKDIAPLLGRNAKCEEDLLINDLKLISPPSLKLMASIFQHSNVAQREKAISRFQSSSSVNVLIRNQTNMPHLYTDSVIKDTNLLKSYNRSVNNFFKAIDLNQCPTITMTEFRKKATGLDLINPSSPPPSHQFDILKWELIPLSEIPFTIKIRVDESFNQFMDKRGKHPVYVGSETRIKRAKTSLEMYSTDPLDRVVLSVAELATWVGDDIYLQELLSTLIKEKTTTNPNDIKTSCRQIIGGSFEHRGHLMVIPTGAFCNYDPTIMSHITIITDTAINFTKKHENYSIMFQLLKVAIGSRIAHMYYSNLNVVGEWGAVLRCQGCTQLIYDGNYSLKAPSTYYGLPLRLTGMLKYESRAMNLAQSPAYEAGHAYFGYKLAKSIIDWDHVERVSETDSIDRFDIHHNTSVNLTEISRLDCNLLISYALLYIALDSKLWEAFNSRSYLGTITSFSPMEYFMNTLLMGGHGQNIVSFTGGAFGYSLDNPDDRCRAFLYIVQNRSPDMIRKLRVLLPEFDELTNVRIMKLILRFRGVNSDEVSEFHRLFTRGGFMIAPPEDVSVKAIREHPLTVSSAKKCKLSRTILGGSPSQMEKFMPCNSTTYGTTVYASQIWSFAHKLPLIDVWILNDYGGDIGIVLGHSERKIYIHDPTSKKYEKIRITNGPS